MTTSIVAWQVEVGGLGRISNFFYAEEAHARSAYEGVKMAVEAYADRSKGNSYESRITFRDDLGEASLRVADIAECRLVNAGALNEANTRRAEDYERRIAAAKRDGQSQETV